MCYAAFSAYMLVGNYATSTQAYEHHSHNESHTLAHTSCVHTCTARRTRAAHTSCQYGAKLESCSKEIRAHAHTRAPKYWIISTPRDGLRKKNASNFQTKISRMRVKRITIRTTRTARSTPALAALIECAFPKQARFTPPSLDDPQWPRPYQTFACV